MVRKKYDLALKQIDSVRNIYIKSSPAVASAMGMQYEVYINALKNSKSKNGFANTYKEELHKKYISLPVRSQIILSNYFNIDADQAKKEVYDLLQSRFNNKENVDINTAILLCKKYNSYVVSKASFKYARQFLEEQDKKHYLVQDSIVIKTRSKNSISIRVVLNNKIKKPESTIVVNTIYSSPDDINDAKEIASNGYMCVYINARGKYLSNDKIEPFEHEAEDINEVIDWIIKQPWSNGKIGMIGGSYLGFSQWAAAKKLHPALKTIIPQVAVGIGIDYPMVNNVFMSYMAKWLDYVTVNKTTNDERFSDEDKWKDIYKKWYSSGQAFKKLDSISGNSNEIFQRWLQHPSYDSYWQGMTPDQKEFSKINIPILTTTGYFDDDQIGALSYYNNHLKHNQKANHYLIIGPYNHSGGQGFIKNEVQGLKIDEVANINLNKICFEWFDYILKDKQKPEFLKGKINYEVIGKNVWKSADSMSGFERTKKKYYLGDNLILSENQSKPQKFSNLSVDLSDRKDVDQQLRYEYNIVTDSLLNTGNYLQYETLPFTKEAEFTGSFSGDLSFSINKKDCDISLFLYEVLPNGKYFLLSSYTGRASYSKNNAKRQALIPNQKESLSITNTSFISKKIEKGSKLLLLAGINKSPLWQINYGTGKDVSNETMADAKELLEIKWFNDSYIELPITEQ
ncbi:CocE/NonD family hydrolase [Epilithonimonas zeae]|nr:CocE/NonD family hydrolase [Epilithonimonas zeae]